MLHQYHGSDLFGGRLDLGFLQPIAMAISFSPARRPVAPVLRQNSRDWCNIRVKGMLHQYHGSDLFGGRLDLGFLQPIAMAISFSLARRPVAPVLRQNSRDWCNIRVKGMLHQYHGSDLFGGDWTWASFNQ